MFLSNSTFPKNFRLCEIREISIFTIKESTFLISTLLDFTFISSLFSSQRTILVSIDGVQRALNLHVTTFFFLNVVAWWWVCTFLTNLLISGYFSSQVRHMCCTYQWTLSPCCRYSHQFLEHPLHELGHAYVPSLYFATLSCH